MPIVLHLEHERLLQVRRRGTRLDLGRGPSVGQRRDGVPVVDLALALLDVGGGP